MSEDESWAMAAEHLAGGVVERSSGRGVQQQNTDPSIDQRHRDTALQYARIIQNQKDWEAQNLKAIETLLEYPTETPITSADAIVFTQAMKSFRPLDFDDLIEERRIDSKCGYPLCPKQLNTSSKINQTSWKAKKGERDFCSVACAKKAAFVRAQLLDVPAWERLPGQEVAIVLPEPDQNLLRQVQPLVGDGKSMRQVATTEDLKELAMERGEHAASLRPQQVMRDAVLEKNTGEDIEMVTAPSGDVGSAGSIEGYQPKSKMQSAKQIVRQRTDTTLQKSEDEEEDDSDDSDDLNDLAKEVFKQLGKR